MPPRTYRNLTPEELAELQLTPHAAVPRLPALAAAPSHPTPWRVEMGDLAFLDDPSTDARVTLPETQITAGQDPSKDAWLDELIGNPPSTPRRPMVSAAGASGAQFTGEDTPESRELIKQRGMQVTEQAPPSNDDLLNAQTSQRPSSMPDLGDQESWLDDLIASEGAAMDREQRPAAPQALAQATPERRSREDEVLDVLQPPSRAQGWLSVLSDALYGGHAVDDLNARGREYQGARAQARMQDVAAAERADDQAADREMMGRRMDLTARGQDLANARGEENQHLRWLLEQQRDQRVREEGAAGRGAAMERTQLMANSKADAGAPELSPEQRAQTEAGWLMQQVNDVPLAKVDAYLAGNREGIPPEKLEQLDANHRQWRGASSKTQQSMIGKGTGREGATPDQTAASIERKLSDPKEILSLKTGVDETGRDIARAARGWAKMSPQAKKAFVSLVPNGDFASAVRQGLMTPEEQKYASDVQQLANGLVKQTAGSAVTASEWKRIANAIGFAPGDWSVLGSPEVIDHWIGRAKEGWVGRVNNVRSVYGNLWGADGGP